ncbi:TRAK2 protein, partial [Acromyrmex insinuator]
MLLRGIAFAEARRNSARRVFKSRDKTQGCERDAASDLSHGGSLARHVRMEMMAYQPLEVPLSSIFSNSFHPKMSQLVAAKYMKKSKSFVQKWVQRYNVAKNVDDLLERGLICKVDKKDDKKIVNLFSRNESEAISLFATASKLATVEDEGPKRPEGPIRPSAASLKVSPTARAILQASRSSKKLVTPVSTRDAETITDVCSGEELPEVEIISLLEEQIPRYRLRADTLTQFQGYENADWFIPAPALKSEDVDLKLSPDQIRETLNYFKLAIPNFRGQDHVKVMNSSTPLRANSDASPSPLHSPIYQQDEAIPSTSRGRHVSSIITHTFDSLALDVSYAGLGASESDLVDSGSTRTILNTSLRENASNLPQFWEDIGVVEYLERRLGPPDESTPEERVATLREVLAERTDIHEGDGNLSDFLFHVARTKHGKIYIRVIRTLLLNRGKC